MNNVFASLMIAGLVAGSVARAEDHAAATTTTTETKATEHKDSCKDHNECKGKKKAHKAKKSSKKVEETHTEEAHH